MITKTGDWNLFRTKLNQLSTNLFPSAKAKLYENGKLVVEKIEGHIDRQDLPWVSLSEATLMQKSTTDIYVETGALRDSFCVTKTKENSKGVTYHIGVSPTKVHPESGMKYTDILMYMEYGTLTQPSRPLIQPTNREIQNQLKQEWIQFLKEEIGGR